MFCNFRSKIKTQSNLNIVWMMMNGWLKHTILYCVCMYYIILFCIVYEFFFVTNWLFSLALKCNMFVLFYKNTYLWHYRTWVCLYIYGVNNQTLLCHYVLFVMTFLCVLNMKKRFSSKFFIGVGSGFFLVF